MSHVWPTVTVSMGESIFNTIASWHWYFSIMRVFHRIHSAASFYLLKIQLNENTITNVHTSVRFARYSMHFSFISQINYNISLSSMECAVESCNAILWNKSLFWTTILFLLSVQQLQKLITYKLLLKLENIYLLLTQQINYFCLGLYVYLKEVKLYN